MKHAVTVALIVATLAGCKTTGQRIRDLEPDSSREYVISHLGKPDAMRMVGDFEVLTYLYRNRNRRSLFNTNYTVILKQDKVVEYGPGLARREGLRNVVIVPPMGD
ncbi:hypothetical protein [Lysobacter sp. CA199]|uniref:hypothetical protein n=1 Tax=Lysobacter sp. CA199 TaxID=3455608 RepID=UPI003F8D39E6